MHAMDVRFDLIVREEWTCQACGYNGNETSYCSLCTVERPRTNSQVEIMRRLTKMVLCEGTMSNAASVGGIVDAFGMRCEVSVAF